MTRSRVHSTVLMFVFLAAMTLAYAIGVRVAEAATETPEAPQMQIAVATVDTAWDLVEQHGPIWGGMLLVFGAGTVFLRRNEREGWLKRGRWLAVVVGGVGVIGSVLEAGINGGTWAGVIVTGMAALKLILDPALLPGPKSTAATGVIVSLVLVVGLGGCTHNDRTDTIHAAMVATDGAHAGFVAWDRAHQFQLVEAATSREQGQAALAAYRAEREQVELKLAGVYRACAAAALLNDDKSLGAALAALDQLHQAIRALTGGSIP